MDRRASSLAKSSGLLACITLAIMLGACKEREAPQPAEPQPSVTSAAQVPKASIMRPGIEAPEAMPEPLKPLRATIGFPAGGAELDEAAVKELEALIKSPQAKLGGPFELGAHTDSAGSDAANMREAKARGQAVKAWLADHGIDQDRITLIIFGEQNPIAPNALPNGQPDEGGRAKNRRVEVLVQVPGQEAVQKRKPTLVEEIEDRPSPGPAAQ